MWWGLTGLLPRRGFSPILVTEAISISGTAVQALVGALLVGGQRRATAVADVIVGRASNNQPGAFSVLPSTLDAMTHTAAAFAEDGSVGKMLNTGLLHFHFSIACRVHFKDWMLHIWRYIWAICGWTPLNPFPTACFSLVPWRSLCWEMCRNYEIWTVLLVSWADRHA